MQALPKRKLDAGFASRVLELAEKQLLADDQWDDEQTAAPVKPLPTKSDDRAAWRRIGHGDSR